MQFKYFNKTFTIDEDKLKEVSNEAFVEKHLNFLNDLKQDNLENNLMYAINLYDSYVDKSENDEFNSYNTLFIRDEKNVYNEVQIYVLEKCMTEEDLSRFIETIPDYAKFDDGYVSRYRISNNTPVDTNDNYAVCFNPRIDAEQHMLNAFISDKDFVNPTENLDFRDTNNYIYKVDTLASEIVEDYYTKELEKDNVPITKYVENAIDINMHSLKFDNRIEDKKEYILSAAEEQKEIDNYLKKLNFKEDENGNYSTKVGKHTITKYENDIYTFSNQSLINYDTFYLSKDLARQFYSEATITNEQAIEETRKIDEYLEKNNFPKEMIIEDVQAFYNDVNGIYRFEAFQSNNIDRIATLEETKEYYENIMAERKAVADFLEEHNLKFNSTYNNTPCIEFVDGFNIIKHNDNYEYAHTYQCFFKDDSNYIYDVSLKDLKDDFKLNEEYNVPYTFGPVFNDEYICNLDKALKYKEELENKEFSNIKEEKQKDDFDLEM